MVAKLVIMVIDISKKHNRKTINLLFINFFLKRIHRVETKYEMLKITVAQ